MGVHLRKCLLALFALALVAAPPAFAQTGEITGRITDARTGAPIAGARVEAVNADNRVAASAISQQNGQYRLSGLEAGSYAVVVSMVGFETARVEDVRVVAGQTSMQAIALNATVFELNPVVVSASKRQEKVLDAPASVAVVDARAVSSRPSTSPVDHLRALPGVDIAQHGVQATSVVVRGFNNIFSGSLHALTDNRIAGVPSLRVNVLHFIPSTDDDVERMEVVLGPGAALYGPNTANGVLHVVTKSPLDHQGTSVSVAGGNQSLMSGSFRSSHLLSDNFGIKVSGQYLQADEWYYADPIEVNEKNKFAGPQGAFFKTDMMNAFGISSEEADRRIGLIGNRDYDVQRYSGDLRADWRINDNTTAVFAGGLTKVGTGIELTGLGAAQAKNWTYSYLQARLMSGRFFAQAYANMSNAGDTYLLRNGAPISDRSKLYVAQAQHGFSLGERQDFTYGLDFLYTNPVTEGTINGVYEDDDQTTEFGAYLQSDTRLTDKLNLVLAGRIDTHSALPEAIFSPRAGLVFKPTEEHAFRVTYNRAFSTPNSLNQFLDLGTPMPDANAARLGYSARVRGTGTDGFSFRQDDGTYLWRMATQFGGDGTINPVNSTNTAIGWGAAVGTLQMAGVIDDTTAAFLNSLAPEAMAAISWGYWNPTTGAYGSLDKLDLTEIKPIRESTSTTFEAGYKGVLGERLLLAADVWYSRRENLVTPLTFASPFVTLDVDETVEFLTDQFVTKSGLSAEEAKLKAMMLACGTVDGNCKEGLARIPIGVLSSPDVDVNSPQVLMTYFNVDDAFDVYGVDLAVTALLTDAWQLSGTVSLVNDNVFETDEGQKVTLNAPKTKGSLALAYRDMANGLNAEVRARYNDSFPVRSGVYNGDICIGGDPEAGSEPCVDSYTLFDLNFSYRLPVLPNASLQLSVQNLLDKDYRSFPGVPTIGRMAMFRVKYDL